jgi:hypothetical protein
VKSKLRSTRIFYCGGQGAGAPKFSGRHLCDCGPIDDGCPSGMSEIIRTWPPRRPGSLQCRILIRVWLSRGLCLAGASHAPRHDTPRRLRRSWASTVGCLLQQEERRAGWTPAALAGEMATIRFAPRWIGGRNWFGSYGSQRAMWRYFCVWLFKQ